MTYQPQSEHHRQHERTYRLGMQGGWTQGAPWTKRFLIIIAVLWLIALVGSRIDRSGMFGAIIINLYLTPASVASGMIWQLFTAPWFGTWCIFSFLFHLMYLLVFGPKVEREWGSARFLRYYLIIAFLSTLIGFLLRLPSPMLNAIPASTASAAIFAVMIAYVSMWPRDPFWVFGMFPAPVLYVVLVLCGLEVVFMVLGGAGEMGGDFVATVAAIGLGFAAVKIPAVRSLFIGDKKKKIFTTGTRAKKAEFRGSGRRAGQSGGAASGPSSPPSESSSKKEEKKKGKRSGFLEL